jgi:hypothetical protein
MPCWFGGADTLVSLRDNSLRAHWWRPKQASQAAGVVLRLAVSDVCSAAISRQCGIDAFDQGGSGEGLGQKANCSGLQRSGSDAVIGERRYENERRMVTLNTHKG